MAYDWCKFEARLNAFTIPDDIAKALQFGGPPPPVLSADERYACDQLDFFNKKGLAYAPEMGNRPQTLYGIEDSPTGLAAWMLDHDAELRAHRTGLCWPRRGPYARRHPRQRHTLLADDTAVSSARGV